jgi:hypothetical protein
MLLLHKFVEHGESHPTHSERTPERSCSPFKSLILCPKREADLRPLFWDKFILGYIHYNMSQTEAEKLASRHTKRIDSSRPLIRDALKEDYGNCKSCTEIAGARYPDQQLPNRSLFRLSTSQAERKISLPQLPLLLAAGNSHRLIHPRIVGFRVDKEH